MAGDLRQADPLRELLLLAGGGVYPLELLRSARRAGVGRIVVIAFRWETDRAVIREADEVRWISVGQLRAFLDTAESLRIPHAVMAGRIRPMRLFHLRPDREAFELLAKLRVKNAESIFGAIAERLAERGIRLLPAHTFMEEAMPKAGLLGGRPPTPREEADIALGRRISRATSGLDIGQTVVIRDGVVLAVEAFEGTDAAIRRGARIGGPGIVIVKRAKQDHDMRFDIPVVGLRTLRLLRRVRASALALEAGRTIILEREAFLREANRIGLCLTAFNEAEDP